MHRREILKGALAGAALAYAAPALARAPAFDAKAERASESTVRLAWDAKAKPVSIYVGDRPDAPRAGMKLVKAGASGGAAEAPGPVSPRPYYLLASADGAETRVAERLLPLKGGRNFRDMGGYRSADGRQVRWGRLYRSGVMVGLTEADMAYLHGLGIRTVCDLRSADERGAAPSPFMKVAGVEVLSVDYKMTSSMVAISQAKSREQALQSFADAYVGFIDTLEPQYRAMFARLVRGEAPLAVNCTAGKDRTGMASALILSVLGVPRETVVYDYNLTQVYSPSQQMIAQMSDPTQAAKLGMPPEQARMLAAMPKEVLEVMIGADGAVMRQALAKIDANYGGPVQMAKARFGLTDADVATLRRTYLA